VESVKPVKTEEQIREEETKKEADKKKTDALKANLFGESEDIFK